MSKKLAILAAAAMLLTGCGGLGGENTETAGSEDSSTAAPETAQSSSVDSSQETAKTQQTDGTEKVTETVTETEKDTATVTKEQSSDPWDIRITQFDTRSMEDLDFDLKEPEKDQSAVTTTAAAGDNDFWFDTSDAVKRKIEWNSTDNKYTFWVSVNIPVHIYDYYTELPRYYLPGEYINYIDDEYNRGTVRNIADALQGVADEYGYSFNETVYEVIRFVQSIPYMTDMDSKGVEEYPKYPIETLYDNCGDCEDLSILLASILREMGIGVCFIDYPTHIAVAVQAADDSENYNFDIFDKHWFYVETTDLGWKLGQMPENRIGQSATLYRIN